MLGLRWNSRKLNFYSKLCLSFLLLLLAGCPNEMGGFTPPPARQPTNSIYQLDTVSAFASDPQVVMAGWISQHPNVEIISVTAAHGNGFMLIIYKAR
jgi:hypothetical protein